MSFRKIQEHPTGFEQNREKGFWSVVVPEETYNLFKDPSFESSTWSSPLTVSTAFASGSEVAYGKRAPTVQGGSTPTLTYTYPNTDSTFSPNKTYTWSFAHKGQAGESFQAQIIWSNGSTVLATLATWKATGFKERKTLTFTVPGTMTTAQSIQFVIKDLVTGGFNFWTDAWQLEQKAYATTYCDGDQPGCQWTGEQYNSASYRSADVPGGRIYEFKKDFNFSVMASQGAGLPPMVHQTSDLPVRGGKNYIKTLPAENTITIVGALEGRGEDEIERKRDIMEQTLVPRTGTNTDEKNPPLLKLRHTVYNKTTQKTKEVEKTVIYSGGLEGDNASIYQDRIALQFTEFMPIGYTETQENTLALAVQTRLNTSNAYMKRITGEWVALPRSATPTSGVTVALAEDVNHHLWIATGSGTTYKLDRIVSNPLTGESIAATWTSYFNAPILAIAFQPDKPGFALVGGAFNFGAVQYIGQASGSNGFDPVITLNNTVRAIWVDPTTGKIWIGGDFTGAGPGAASNRIIVLNPDFSVYATLNCTQPVYSFAPGPVAGQVYVSSTGGSSINGTTFNAVALVTLTGATSPTVTVDALGSTTGTLNYLTGPVYTLKVGPDGILYAGGKFSSIGSGTGSVSAFSIAKMVAGHWQPMGGGLLNNNYPNYWVNSIAFDKYGNVYAGGTFDQSYNSAVAITPGYAMWDKTQWLPVEHSKQASLSTQIPLGQVLITSDGRQVVAYESAANDNFLFAAATDIAYAGSAPAYPRVKIHLDSIGSGRVYKLVNFSTKTEIYLNYALTYKEVLTLDFTPGQVDIVSSLYGSIKSRIVSSSKINSFRLQEGRNGAGKNRIMLFVDSNLVSAEIYWKNTYWGVDGGAR